MCKQAQERSQGFAVVAVLWAGVLLALIAAAFASAVRGRVRTVAAKYDVARAQALADAGINIAILERTSGAEVARGRVRFEPNGIPVYCSISDARLTISVLDEEGLVNLNSATDEVLAALFKGLGATDAEASRYVALIRDFTDSDDEKRDEGAEKADYGKAGLIAPKNADFIAAEELDQVMGIPAALRNKAKKHVTTVMGHTGIDPAVASRDLKQILARGASLFVRSATENNSDSIFNAEPLPEAFRSESRHQAYLVRSQARLPSGAVYGAETAVILRPGQQPQFRYWQRGSSTLPESEATQTLPPC